VFVSERRNASTSTCMSMKFGWKTPDGSGEVVHVRVRKVVITK